MGCALPSSWRRATRAPRAGRRCAFPLVDSPRYRLLIADIDGTLVPEDKIVRPGVVAAVKAARARGVRVCLATGRQPRSAHRFVEAVGADPPPIGYNGRLCCAFQAAPPFLAR